jgi:hypothetical protein
MRVFKLLLSALGGLFLIAAAGAAAELGSSAYKGEGPGTIGDWCIVILVVLGLLAIAVGLLYWSGRIERRQLSAEQAAPDSESMELVLCPECGAADLVQGPKSPRMLFGSIHIARCVECGCRFELARSQWQHLPLPQFGEPYEMWEDKRHLVLWTPMSSGQIVIVGGAFVGWLVLAFMASDEVSMDLLGIVLVVAICAAWFLGRMFFPRRCVVEEVAERDANGE